MGVAQASVNIMKGDGVVHPASLTTPNSLFVRRAVHGHDGLLVGVALVFLCVRTVHQGKQLSRV